MHPARIAELLEPFLADDRQLTADDLLNISTYINLVLHWNARINLTAVRHPEEIVTRHFGESFFAARHLFPGPSAPSASSAVKAVTLADLGSGAGFPGLPIKLWARHISLTLIESKHKKATFLREVVRALTLTDVNILTARAETITSVSFDVVTLRAVERFPSILPIAARLVAPGGRLALLIASAQLAHARSLLPHLAWAEPEPVPLSRSRILAVAHRLIADQ
jgi:16S rRNA (guanine527-N7)-methyltransferase